MEEISARLIRHPATRVLRHEERTRRPDAARRLSVILNLYATEEESTAQ